MSIKLSDKFTYSKLLRFAFPTMIMMVFASIYSVVDGLFVSNFAGKDALAAVNLIFPLIMAIGCIGYMLGTGGAALVAKVRGEGSVERANGLFTFILVATVIAGVLVSIIGYFAMRPFLEFMGATGQLTKLSVQYGQILFIALTFFILQNVFQSFFVVAEKPHIGLVVVLSGGFTNILLDFVFIGIFEWGVVGAALATAIGQILTSIISISYFFASKTAAIKFAKPIIDFRALGKACVNGSSELMTEIAASIVAMLYNLQLMKLIGADGVAAYGVIMYVNFIFVAIFFGFAMGTGPVISFNYGAGRTNELSGLLKKSLTIVGIFGVSMFGLSQVLGLPIVKLFVGYDPELVDLTIHGFRIYSAAFLIMGFNVYGSAFFTALNNGLVSAIISFVRTLVLETATVMILPIWFGVNGVWSAIIVAELFALVLTASFLVGLRGRYQY